MNILFQARKSEDDLEELDEEKLLKSDDEGDGLVIIFLNFFFRVLSVDALVISNLFSSGTIIDLHRIYLLFLKFLICICIYLGHRDVYFMKIRLG